MAHMVLLRCFLFSLEAVIVSWDFVPGVPKGWKVAPDGRKFLSCGLGMNNWKQIILPLLTTVQECWTKLKPDLHRLYQRGVRLGTAVSTAH